MSLLACADVCVQPRRASHSAAIHTGRLSTTAATTIASGPSNPGSSDAAAVTVASPEPTPQAARRNPSHHNRRHASASGRPQGATKTSEGAAANTIGNHIPNISDGVISSMRWNAVVVTTPTGSQSSASGQNPRRLADFPLVHITHNSKPIRDALRREVCAHFALSFLYAMKPDTPLPLARRSV